MLTKPQSCWSNDYWERCTSILGSRYGIANPNRIHRLCLNQDRICINWNWKGVKVESAIFTRNWPDVGRVWIKLDLKWTQTHSIRQCLGTWVLLGYVLWINFQLSSGALSPLCFLKSNKEPNGVHQTCVIPASPHTIKSTARDFLFQLNFSSFKQTVFCPGNDKIVYSRKNFVASPVCWPLLCSQGQTDSDTGWVVLAAHGFWWISNPVHFVARPGHGLQT